MTPNPTSEPELELQPTKVPEISKTPDEAAGEDAGASEPTVAVAEDPATGDRDAEDSAAAVPAATAAAAAEDSAAAVPATVAMAAEDSAPDEQPDEQLGAGEDELAFGSEPATGSDRRATLVPLVGALLGLTALASVLLISFGLPALKSGPDRLPIGVSGAPAVTSQLKNLFVANGSHTFKVTVYTQASALRTAIEHRKVYGGLTVTDSGATMLVASAASPVVAEALGSVATELSSRSGTQIPVSDIVAMPSSDSRGTGLAAVGLPMVIAGLLPALLLIQLYRRRPLAQLGLTVVASVLLGCSFAAILSYWFGSTKGANYGLLSLSLAAGVLAASLILLGLNAVAGRIGLGLGVAVLVLLGAPLSGLSSAPEWLSSPWGGIGQLLPPGASATLLRSAAFFSGHGAGTALLVLGGWSLLGLLLLGLSNALSARKAQPAG
jgi:hypothetical protein